MDKIIACCGITCTECLGYIATQKDCDVERAKVAKMWLEQFDSDIKPEHINSDGCLPISGGRVMPYHNMYVK